MYIRKCDNIALENMGTDSLKGLTFVSHNSLDEQGRLAAYYVDYDANEADSRNTNHLSLFKVFFVHLTWVNLFSPSGKYFLGIIFLKVYIFLFWHKT